MSTMSESYIATLRSIETTFGRDSLAFQSKNRLTNQGTSLLSYLTRKIVEEGGFAFDYDRLDCWVDRVVDFKFKEKYFD